MANPKNTADLAELKEKLADSSSVVLTEYRGLTVSQLQELRNNLGFDVDYSVATSGQAIRGNRLGTTQEEGVV